MHRWLQLSKLVIFSLVFLSQAGKVTAHATPTEYDPPNQSVLDQSPGQVTISYSERVEEKVSLIRVFDGQGNRVDHGDSQVLPDDARAFQVSVPSDLADDHYTVAWQLVSADDGHFSKGAYTFSIGQPTSASLAEVAQIQIQHVTSIPEAVTIFTELVGQSSLVAVVAIWLIHHRAKKPDHFKLRLLAWVGIALILLGACSHLVLKSLDLQQLIGTQFWLSFGQYLQTEVGRFTMARIVLAVGTLIVLASSKLRSRWLWLLAGLILAQQAIRARVSHAAASLFAPELSVAITWIHLISKELWIGMALLTVWELFTKVKPPAWQQWIRLFSWIVLGSLLIGGLSGLYIIWLDLKSFDHLYSEWGSRMQVVAWLGGWLGLTSAGFFGYSYLTGWRRFKWVGTGLAVGQAWAGLLVLLATSFLIITTPPLTLQKYTYQQVQTVDQHIVTLAPDPWNQDQLLISLQAVDSNSPVSVDQAQLQLTSDEHGIGPIVLLAETLKPGTYVVPLSYLTPAGRWNVAFDATLSNQTELTADFRINYPGDIEATVVDPAARTFNHLALVATTIGVGMVIVTGGLVFVSAKYPVSVNAVSKMSAVTLSVSSVAWLVTLLASTWLVFEVAIMTPFQRQCLKDGHFWLQSTPIRNGQVLSPNTATGCTLNIGLHHFADQDRYQEFTEPTSAFAELQLPESIVASQPTQFQVNITDDQGNPVSDLAIEHDRYLHVVLIGQDLATFAHIHPDTQPTFSADDLAAGSFTVTHTFPAAGQYLVILDYAVNSQPFSDQFLVDVAATDESETLQPFEPNQTSLVQTIEDYQVSLTVPERISANQEYLFRYHLTKQGQPLTDLEPYLAAAMHVAIVKSDFTSATHTHGQISLPGSMFFQTLFQSYSNFHAHFVPDAFGPDIDVPIVFPEPGMYVIFGEFAHQGQTHVTRFIVEVE